MKQQLHKIECQQTIVNSLKLQIQNLKEQNAERERHLSFLIDSQAREVKDFENKIEDLKNFSTCKICLINEIDTCSHCIACHKCSEHKTIKSCPKCRTEIFTKLRIGF